MDSHESTGRGYDLERRDGVARTPCESHEADHFGGAEIETEVRQVRAEMERLSQAIVSTNDAPTMLVEMLKEREKRISELEQTLAHARASLDLPAIDMANIDKIARERLCDLVSMMQRHPDAARKAIEAIVAGPLRFIPVETGQGRRYRIEGPMASGEMAVTECG